MLRRRDPAIQELAGVRVLGLGDLLTGGSRRGFCGSGCDTVVEAGEMAAGRGGGGAVHRGGGRWRFGAL